MNSYTIHPVAQNYATFSLEVGFLLKTEVEVFMYLCMYVRTYACSLIAREWMNQFAPELACLFLETIKRYQKG